MQLEIEEKPLEPPPEEEKEEWIEYKDIWGEVKRKLVVKKAPPGMLSYLLLAVL
jgi:hypothetical protein